MLPLRDRRVMAAIISTPVTAAMNT
jgi:hypothetical protein